MKQFDPKDFSDIEYDIISDERHNILAVYVEDVEPRERVDVEIEHLKVAENGDILYPASYVCETEDDGFVSYNPNRDDYQVLISKENLAKEVAKER